MSEPPFWEAIGFEQGLAEWIRRQNPGLCLIGIAIRWIRQQVASPYVGVTRRTEIAPNYWWGRIPGSYHDGGADVLCGYYIDEDLRQVRCDVISTLYRPNLG